MRWLTEHASADSSPPPRAIYDQAVALVCESPPRQQRRRRPGWLARRTALAGYRERAGAGRGHQPHGTAAGPAAPAPRPDRRPRHRRRACLPAPGQGRRPEPGSPAPGRRHHDHGNLRDHGPRSARRRQRGRRHAGQSRRRPARRLPGGRRGAGRSPWPAGPPGSPCCTSSAPGPVTATGRPPAPGSPRPPAAASPRRPTRACSSAHPHWRSCSTSPSSPPATAAARSLPWTTRPCDITRTCLASAHARMDRGEQPELREFDLIRGLAGLGAYHLAAHPGHRVTRDVLACLARLTEPLPGAQDGLPPWWTSASPSGEPSPDFPGGHGNFGMSHGISAVLAVLSLAIMRGITVPGAQEAARRICAWTDQWRHGDQAAPGGRASSRCGRPRPAGWTRRSGRVPRGATAWPGRPVPSSSPGWPSATPPAAAAAEAAILAVLRDPAELGRLTEPGLCHGTAGLLQAAWRMAADATSRRDRGRASPPRRSPSRLSSPSTKTTTPNCSTERPERRSRCTRPAPEAPPRRTGTRSSPSPDHTEDSDGPLAPGQHHLPRLGPRRADRSDPHRPATRR